MNTEPVDVEAEVQALQTVLASLLPLSGDARKRVIAYALTVFGGVGQSLGSLASNQPLQREPAPREPRPFVGRDIRSLKDEKQPKSAIEMAALVAYYLSEVAAELDRSADVSTAELDKYFKQANFPLPGAIDKVLPNASQAGYFDSLGRGRYKLNPVGYNLVVHSLPAGSAQGKSRTVSARPKAAGRRAASKPTKATKSKKRPPSKTKPAPSRTNNARTASAETAAPASGEDQELTPEA